jgi:glycosyltransferase involved in cell wall biosynthesis
MIKRWVSHRLMRWLEGMLRWLVIRSRQFNEAFYRDEYPDVADANISPLVHYCRYGWREGRRPSPMVHPHYIASGPIGRHFPRCNPIAVWMILGRWVGWTLAWPQLREWDLAKAPVRAPIALVLHEATRTGAPIFALRFARWLRRAGGVEPVFVLLADGTLFPELWNEFTCIPIFAVAPSERMRFLSTNLLDVRALYLNSLASLEAWKLLAWEGKGLVLHVHESAASLPVYINGLTAVAPARPCVIAVNRSCRAPLADTLGTQPHIVPPAVESIQQVIRTHKHGRQTVVGCGTMSWRKGADLFCHVAAHISKHLDRNVDFLWLGGSGDIDMRALISGYHLADRVRLAGEVADPLPILATTSVLMLPSRDDPFPLVALEAASCGIPITCFDALADGVGSWISNGAGAMVPAFDVDAMATAVMRLLTDETWHTAASEAALEASKRFDIDVVGPLIGSIINEAVGEMMVVSEPPLRF